MKRLTDEESARAKVGAMLRNAETERDAALAKIEAMRQELHAWRNCFICIECGRGAVDEDGCCTTCGRDALIFADGRLANRTYVDALEADVRRETANCIATWLENRASAVDWVNANETATAIRAGAWKRGAK